MLGFIKRLFGSNERQIRHSFTEDDRSMSAETRRLNHALRMQSLEQQRLMGEMKLEKAKAELEMMRMELDERRAEMEGDEDDGDFMSNPMVMGLVQGFLKGKGLDGLVPSAPQGVPAAEVAKVNLTDDEIRKLVDALPRATRALLKRMDDSTLQKMARSQMPGADDSTIDRAILLLKA